jgi:hypothetical protein
MENYEINDLIYSMGVEHPGAITLHNYPRALQRHERIDAGLEVWSNVAPAAVET